MASTEKASENTSDASYSHVEKGKDSLRQGDKLDPRIRDDHGDPHRAALEGGDEESRVSKSTWAAVFFLGFTFQPSLTFTILCCFPILVGSNL